MPSDSRKQVLCINTGGAGGTDDRRARRLCAALDAEVTHIDVDRNARRASGRAIGNVLSSRQWDLVYQESTGLAGGLNLIRAARTRRQKFIVSSGDPISGFFHTVKGPMYGQVFAVYEKSLYRACAGFVGWTPYLTGRAIHLGAPRGVTVEGAIDLDAFPGVTPLERRAARERLGLNPEHLVCGVVGSLTWTPRQAYCYGLELVEVLKRLKRSDVSMLIVGDGNGRARLEAAVPSALRSRIVFTGRIPASEIAGTLAAMNIGFITQTLDGLGNYRLTTKLPEYLARGLAVAMSAVPGYYDYVREAGWALPPLHPAHPEFHRLTAVWLDALASDVVEVKASQARRIACERFDYGKLSERFREFATSIWDG